MAERQLELGATCYHAAILRRLDSLDARYTELLAAVAALARRLDDDAPAERARLTAQPSSGDPICRRCGNHDHTTRECDL